MCHQMANEHEKKQNMAKSSSRQTSVSLSCVYFMLKKLSPFALN